MKHESITQEFKEKCHSLVNISLENFMQFLSQQTKIVVDEDLAPGFLYERVNSPNGIDLFRAIMSVHKPDIIDSFDGVRLNLEIQPFASIACMVFLYNHNKGERLDSLNSWIKTK